MVTFKELYDRAFRMAMSVIERDHVPDFIVRAGIRSLLATRLRIGREGTVGEQLERKEAFVEELRSMPVAINTADANTQHYEVPTPYFLLCLGEHLKYSSCLYDRPGMSLEEAEVAMLELYCERAELQDGQDVLELGCGWGSLCLYLAQKYPRSRITAVSNSSTQKAFIDGRAQERGLRNLTVITANVVSFEAPGTYDRVMSIEMFEHMKNYEVLMGRIAR